MIANLATLANRLPALAKGKPLLHASLDGTRRTAPMALALLFLFVFASRNAWAQQSYLLSDQRQTGDLHRVQVTLSVGGNLHVAGRGHEKKPVAEIAANAKLVYHERLATVDDDQIVAGRYYESGEARLQLGVQTEKVSLGDEQRWVLATSRHRLALASGKLPFSRSELDMLTVPGNSLDVYRLLPQDPVEPGDTWKPSEAGLAAVLNLDEVTVSDFEARFVDVNKGLARIQMSGSVSGNVDGAASQVTIQGDMRFDLRWKRISWLRLTVEEDRETSPTQAGFQVKAELRMLCEPLDQSKLTGQLVQRMDESNRNRHAMLRFQSTDGAYHVVHSPAWHVISDNRANTSLRMITQGKTTAQCNIRRLKPLEPGKQLGLAEFQSDIEKALGKRFRRFERAQEFKRPDGYRVLQVAAEGTVGELPIRWVYYHVGNNIGEGAACVFTMELDVAQSFAESDHLIVRSLKLLARKKESTPASPKGAAKSQETAVAPRRNPIR